MGSAPSRSKSIKHSSCQVCKSLNSNDVLREPPQRSPLDVKRIDSGATGPTPPASARNAYRKIVQSKPALRHARPTKCPATPSISVSRADPGPGACARGLRGENAGWAARQAAPGVPAAAQRHNHQSTHSQTRSGERADWRIATSDPIQHSNRYANRVSVDDLRRSAAACNCQESRRRDCAPELCYLLGEPLHSDRVSLMPAGTCRSGSLRVRSEPPKRGAEPDTGGPVQDSQEFFLLLGSKCVRI